MRGSFRFGYLGLLGWGAGMPQPNNAADGCQGSPLRGAPEARADGITHSMPGKPTEVVT